MKKIAWIVLVTSALAVYASESICGIAIYYIPLQIKTYKDVTQSNIKDRAFYRGELTDKNKQRALLEIFSSVGEGSGFDQKRIRLLVVTDNREIFVDAEGNVLDAEKKFRLDQKQFQKLKTMMTELAVSAGMEKKKR
jgi:hypothetical protein